MKVVHIEERFHPEMGYQVNFFARYHKPSIDFWILASDSLALWANVSLETIDKLDHEFEKKYNVHIVRLRARFDRKGKYNLWLIGLQRKIDDIKPDLIYIHALETFSSFRICIGRISKKYPVAADTHTLLSQFAPGIRTKVMLFMIRAFITPVLNKNTSCTFYTAPENKHILENLYHIEHHRIHSCSIGTDDTVYFHDPEAGKALRREFGIAENDQVLIYAGKMIISKGPHLILHALDLIKEKIHEPLHLLFIGAADQDYVDKYFNLSFPPNIRILRLPPVNSHELFRYYSIANFAVFPKENTLSSLDAQACALPVIMEDDETNSERLKEGGLLYNQGNIQDLGARIWELIADRELCKQLGMKGKKYILDNYSYRNIIVGMERQLELLLEEWRRQHTSGNVHNS